MARWLVGEVQPQRAPPLYILECYLAMFLPLPQQRGVASQFFEYLGAGYAALLLVLYKHSRRVLLWTVALLVALALSSGATTHKGRDLLSSTLQSIFAFYELVYLFAGFVVGTGAH